MITSDRQLNVTKKKIEELKRSLGSSPNKDVNPVLQKAANIQVQSLVEELTAQIQEYDELKSLGLKGIKILSPEDPNTLYPI